MLPAPASCLVAITALGVHIAIDCADEQLATAVRDAWSDAASRTGGSPTVTLTVGFSPECDVTGRDVAEVLHMLSPAVTLQAMQHRAGELVMLHAAALADPETGATAVLVAPSGTGKTTASTTLGRRLAYLSDETSGIAHDGTMVSYPKPLSIIRSGHLKDQVSPSSLGLLTTDRTCHLSVILILDRDAHHSGEPHVTILGTIDALAQLAPQASSLGRLDHPLQRVVDLIDRVGGVRQVTYAEAETLEPVVRRLLSEAP